MNTFYEHHHDSIRFAYRCFDRILLNGLIQPFQQPDVRLPSFADSMALEMILAEGHRRRSLSMAGPPASSMPEAITVKRSPDPSAQESVR